MLRQDGPEQVEGSRRTLRRIEGRAVEARDRQSPTIALGRGGLDLDDRLGGGLRRGALHEVVAAAPGDGAAAAGFAAVLALRCAGRGPLVWIVEDCATHETGAPYRPGLAAHGFDPDRLVLVRTRDGRATLWACEEALRAQAPVVLTELWSAKHYGLAASRRLLLAARAGGGTALLLHAGLCGKGEILSSAAETRFGVAAHPSPRLAPAGGGLPIPGEAAFAVRVLKLRLRAESAAIDRDRVHALVWNPAQRCFDDHPLRVGVSAHLADRQAASFGRRARA